MLDLTGKILFAKISIAIWFSPSSLPALHEDSQKVLDDAIAILEGLPKGEPLEKLENSGQAFVSLLYFSVLGRY